MSCVDTYVPATCKRNGLTLCSLLHFMSQLANGATQTHRFQLIHSTYVYLLLFTPVRPCLSQPSCLSQLISSSNEKYHSIFAVINFNLDEIDFLSRHIVNMLFNHNKIPGNKTFRTTDKESCFISKHMIITKAAEGKIITKINRKLSVFHSRHNTS